MNSLFFDLDGTLTDPRGGIVRCIQYALQELACASPPEDRLLRYIGPPLFESFAKLLGPTDSDAVQQAVSSYRKRFAEAGIFENQLYPGIVATVGELQANGFPLYVVTSKPTMFAARFIDLFELSQFFEKVYGSELDGARADKSDLIGHVLAEERIRPADAIMIGDREQDIKGALANGVQAIGALWGYGTRDELARAGATMLCETPRSLGSFLTERLD
jgi:phosphoglycolate phosphatase